MKLSTHTLAGVVVVFAALLPVAALGSLFKETDLVSDGFKATPFTDANLVNPWGVSFAPTSPFWVSDAGTGKSTLYNGNTGQPQALIVTVPPAPGSLGPSAPTGQVFNPTSQFMAPGTVSPALFIFATEEGTISAWNAGLGTSASIAADRSGTGAIYKGLAMGTLNAAPFLYATDFHNGKIDVFDGNFATASLPNGFIDPNLPAGYAPFGIRTINGDLYVTFAVQDANAEDDVAAPGNGIVDVFDTSGTFIRRFASNGTLNSPWGLEIAPSSFAEFAGDLLVGNFGDGRINVFDPATGNFKAQLLDPTSQPLTIDGLWALNVGNGGAAGPTTTVFFTAGPDGEMHGLFGTITLLPEPSTSVLLILATLLPFCRRP